MYSIPVHQMVNFKSSFASRNNFKSYHCSSWHHSDNAIIILKTIDISKTLRNFFSFNQMGILQWEVEQIEIQIGTNSKERGTTKYNEVREFFLII